VAACPAVLDLVRAAAGEPNRTIGELLAALTPETAALAYERWREVTSVLKEVGSALYLYASEHPIDVGDGQVYGPVRSKRREIDARIARVELAAMAGPEVAEAACDFETSQAAIGRALRPVYEAQVREARESRERGERTLRPTLKGLREAAIARIDAAGGITVKSTITVREHHAKEPPLVASPTPAPEIGSGVQAAAVAGVAGDHCGPGNECGRLGCEECQPAGWERS
jgi:DNA-binding transcriptional ArsR family regulator